MEEKQNESDVPEITLKGGHRIRDFWTVRVIGCVVGAVIPLFLILIPTVNKYADNYKDIAILGIQSDVKYLKERVLQLETELRLCREHFYTTPRKIGFKN
jgi:hypothetical protein